MRGAAGFKPKSTPTIGKKLLEFMDGVDRLWSRFEFSASGEPRRYYGEAGRRDVVLRIRLRAERERQQDPPRWVARLRSPNSYIGDGWVWPCRRRSQCRLGRRRPITAAVSHELAARVTAAEAATIFYLVEGTPVSRGSKWTMLVERLATIATIDQGSERRAQPR